MLKLKSGICRFNGLEDYNRFSKYHKAERLDDIFQDRKVLTVSTKGKYIYVEYK